MFPFAPWTLLHFLATTGTSDFPEWYRSLDLGFWPLMEEFSRPDWPLVDLLGFWICFGYMPCTWTPVDSFGAWALTGCCLRCFILARHPHSEYLTGLDSFTFVTACSLPVYASRRSLPSAPQDSVRRPGSPGYGDGFFPRKLIQTSPNAHDRHSIRGLLALSTCTMGGSALCLTPRGTRFQPKSRQLKRQHGYDELLV